MQFLVYKRQIWNFFTFRRYHRILHTCQVLNEKEKKTYIYSTFLGTTSSYGCVCKLKQKNTMNIRIYRHFFRYINKSIFVFPPPLPKKRYCREYRYCTMKTLLKKQMLMYQYMLLNMHVFENLDHFNTCTRHVLVCCKSSVPPPWFS